MLIPDRAGRLLARRLDHRRRRAAAARALSGTAGRHLRQHLGRRQGRVGHLLHLGERRRGGRVARRPEGDLPARRVPRQVGGDADSGRARALEGALRGARALHRRRDRGAARLRPGSLRARASGVPAGRAGGGRLRRLDRRHDPRGRSGRSAARGDDHRVLDERQRGHGASRRRVRAAVQPLPAHEADHAAEDPAQPRDARASRRGRAGDRACAPVAPSSACSRWREGPSDERRPRRRVPSSAAPPTSW